MWSSKFKAFLAIASRTTSATTVATEIVELSAQMGLVLSINNSNNILSSSSSSSSSTIVTTTPREGREASVESKRVGLGHFPADWPHPFCSIDRSGKSSQMKWPSQYQSLWGKESHWISFTKNGGILRKSLRRPYFGESAIEKRRGFPKFHNLQFPPEPGWVDMKIGLFSKIGFVKSQTAPHRPSWRPRHGQVFFFTISRPQTLQLAQIASD